MEGILVVPSPASFPTCSPPQQEIQSMVSMGWTSNPSLEKLTLLSHHSFTTPIPGVEFTVIMIETKKYKTPVKKSSGPPINPFLKEHRKPLEICKLSDTHVLIYNKFPIVEHHVLVITDKFEKQNSELSQADFRATLPVLKAMYGLAFFNSGPMSGSSQGHKHIQVIPKSAYPDGKVPLSTLIKRECQPGFGWKQISHFKFKHCVYVFEKKITSNLDESAANERAKMLNRIYLEGIKKLYNTDLSYAYNMVMTSEFMFLVLRKQEAAFSSIRVNAVGFTGSFAIRTEEELQVFKEKSALEILEDVSIPIQEKSLDIIQNK